MCFDENNNYALKPATWDPESRHSEWLAKSETLHFGQKYFCIVLYQLSNIMIFVYLEN